MEILILPAILLVAVLLIASAAKKQQRIKDDADRDFLTKRKTDDIRKNRW